MRDITVAGSIPLWRPVNFTFCIILSFSGPGAMSRIISTAALSVNREPQQEAAKPFYFTASAARPRTVSPLTQPIILFNVTLTSRRRRFSRWAYREVG